MTRCFRWTRRCVLRSGFGVVSVLAGLRGPLFAAPAAPGPAARSLILLWMNGGPSHLDTFDPKPGTPEAGPLAAIATSVTGVRFSELLPRLARQAGRLAVIRNVTSVEGDHARAVEYVRTGNRPSPATDFPAIGSVISRERSGANAPPLRAISLLAAGPGAGFLGAEFAPLLAVDPDHPLEGWFPEGYAPEALARRTAVLEELERASADGKRAVRLEAEHRRIGALAHEFLGSPLVAALDPGKEPARVRADYGETPFGKACLLARRLVAAGVPSVEITLDGWDSHVENFRAHRELCATLDTAFAALLADLAASGLLATTVVAWAGEFGRTPAINAQRGRDHHPQAFSAVLAGGAALGGQVVGATDAHGAAVVDAPVTVPELVATLYTALGIPPDRTYFTDTGRPVTLLERAAPIAGLLSTSR
jgi:uncharacterized protein (DUF1501 family)